ncbi:hypothetical protein C8J57DRAFT_1725698 [Mycena rebaudengoi]|nr:hypothetical protein C8J57DRAFT_1725698 [Mycena rebaudengoi]
MGTLPTNAVNPFRVCAASACTVSPEQNHQQPAQQRQLTGVSPFCARRIAPPTASNNIAGRREAFASRPPARPTIYACAATASKAPRSSSPARACLRRLRITPPARWLDGLPTAAVLDQKSHEGHRQEEGQQDDAHGLWLRAPDPHATVLVGVGMAALRIDFSLHDVLLQNPASLCPVLNEDFAGATT